MLIGNRRKVKFEVPVLRFLLVACVVAEEMEAEEEEDQEDEAEEVAKEDEEGMATANVGFWGDISIVNGVCAVNRY